MTRTCIEGGCKIQPHFNKEGETKGLYCATHKKEEMVDVKNKTCIEVDCKIRPLFNKEGETKGLYCATHKKEDMVNVINKTCIEEGCKIQPHFNKEGETKGLYCARHQKEKMVNVIDKNCKTEWCFKLVDNEKYDGYCLFCFMHLFPDKPVSRNYKTKEYSVVEYVKSAFPDLTWIADKSVIDGCSYRRPDLLLDLGYQILIIKVDENQHLKYDCSCENKRVMLVSQDVGHRPIVFIRFNPDVYINNKIKITSCWEKNKNGICVVKKTKKEE